MTSHDYDAVLELASRVLAHHRQAPAVAGVLVGALAGGPEIKVQLKADRDDARTVLAVAEWAQRLDVPVRLKYSHSNADIFVEAIQHVGSGAAASTLFIWNLITPAYGQHLATLTGTGFAKGELTLTVEQVRHAVATDATGAASAAMAGSLR